MNGKCLHIVFGDQARAAVGFRKIYNTNEIDLVCFRDTLSIGPISNLETEKGRQDRIGWLTNVYREFPQDVVPADIDLINELNDRANLYKQIYLWTGSDVNEILCASRLFYFLRDFSCLKIFTIDFLNTSITKRCGYFVYPKSLAETSLDQISELYGNFSLLTQQEFERMRLIWEKLSNENSYLRVVVEGSEILGGEIDFYDASIMAHCTKRYQTAVKVVGKTLGHMNSANIREGIGDSFLNYRLMKLVDNSQLKYRGIMSDLRSYEVKLA